jgi:hypothetical protein
MGEKQIWKYHFTIEDATVLEMPRGAKILEVGANLGKATLWALVDPSADRVSRTIRVRGTGHPIAEELEPLYVGTVLMPPFVWHIFDAGEKPLPRRL